MNELAEHFDVTRPAISQQLRILREHGLVVEERVGRHRFYSLRAARLKEANAWLAEYAAFWDERLDRLRNHLDSAARR